MEANTENCTTLNQREKKLTAHNSTSKNIEHEVSKKKLKVDSPEQITEYFKCNKSISPSTLKSASKPHGFKTLTLGDKKSNNTLRTNESSAKSHSKFVKQKSVQKILDFFNYSQSCFPKSPSINTIISFKDNIKCPAKYYERNKETVQLRRAFSDIGNQIDHQMHPTTFLENKTRKFLQKQAFSEPTPNSFLYQSYNTSDFLANESLISYTKLSDGLEAPNTSFENSVFSQESFSGSSCPHDIPEGIKQMSNINESARELVSINRSHDSNDSESKLKLIEEIVKIKEDPTLIYKKPDEVMFPNIQESKNTLIAKITSILSEAQRSGVLTHRTVSYKNCVFLDDR